MIDTDSDQLYESVWKLLKTIATFPLTILQNTKQNHFYTTGLTYRKFVGYY